MNNLQLLWFFLIGVLFSGYFFLEGFDYGVGMSMHTLAKNEKERDQLVATIGPVWDGNEVWLLTAGGAMFASFPFWYASLFSGYYLLLFTILFGLIIRGVSFEFRHKVEPSKKNFWNWTLTSGSFIVTFFFGIIFISMIQGMPLDANGNMTAHARYPCYRGWGALTTLTANYIALKTDGPIRHRARDYAKVLYYVLYAGLVVFAILLYLQTDFFKLHFATTLALVVLIVLLTVFANISVLKGKELAAFLASGLTLVSLVALLFTGLFPRVMISSISSKFDLLIKNASSTPYTLKIMSIVAITLLPFVLAYFAWTYYIFRKRVTADVAGYEE